MFLCIFDKSKNIFFSKNKSETLVLGFYGKKGNTNSIGQLRTFCILLHLQNNVFYPSSTFYQFLTEGQSTGQNQDNFNFGLSHRLC